MTRSKRRLSTPTWRPRTEGSMRTEGTAAFPSRLRVPASTERCTSSETSTSSRKTSLEPASTRDISRRSLTMRWKRRRSSPRSASAWRERGGRSSCSASSTSSDAANVVRGERSSWLTSELKRASRSMRTWSWSTMALKEFVSPSRSGSVASGSRRVSSSPPAMAPAARDTSARGRKSRLLAKRPRPVPSSVVMIPTTKSVMPRTRSV